MNNKQHGLFNDVEGRARKEAAREKRHEEHEKLVKGIEKEHQIRDLENIFHDDDDVRYSKSKKMILIWVGVGLFLLIAVILIIIFA